MLPSPGSRLLRGFEMKKLISKSKNKVPKKVLMHPILSQGLRFTFFWRRTRNTFLTLVDLGASAENEGLEIQAGKESLKDTSCHRGLLSLECFVQPKPLGRGTGSLGGKLLPVKSTPLPVTCFLNSGRHFLFSSNGHFFHVQEALRSSC
jgi:hypothetical protein